MNQPVRAPISGRRIFGRAQNKQIDDPYEAQHKPHEPTVCDGCGAVYHRGRWQWAAAPEAAHHARCPACRRIDEALPAGLVTLHGRFARDRKSEIIALSRNEEEAESSEHPLNRIIDITDIADGIAISTTDIHLPRRLGTAVKRAYDGKLNIHFDEAGYFVRVNWRRN